MSDSLLKETMSHTGRVCGTCGESIEGSHGRRKFCSEKCRKAQYATPCAECGDPTSGSEGRRPDAVCPPCATRRAHVAWVSKCHDRWDEIAELWKSGASGPEIVVRVGLSDTSHLHTVIAHMRAAGYALPYRKNWTEDGLRAVQARRVAA